jgi:hypothetical protein
MGNDRPDYLSYLLRLWRVENDKAAGADKAVWRASLEVPHTGERRVFASLDELLEFLRQQTGATADTGQAGTPALARFCRRIVRARRNRRRHRERGR